MKTSLSPAFSVVFFLEGVSILLGNIFTIFVFWKHRAELKRTSYLLVNLAVADLLVAISISIFLGCEVKTKEEVEQDSLYCYVFLPRLLVSFYRHGSSFRLHKALYCKFIELISL